MKQALLIVLLAALYAVPSLAAAQSLPVTPTSWIPFAGVAVLAIMGIAALIYALSGVMASPNARNWARIQMYEALLSIIMLLFFGAFSYMFFMNPQAAFGSLNLVPGNAITHTGCTTSTDIFSLSVCDLSLFNSAAVTFSGFMLFVPFIMGMVPGADVVVAAPAALVQGKVQVYFDLSLLPTSLGSLFRNGFKAVLVLLLVNQIQLLLLKGALMFLSLFVTIGLVARTLGFSRSFGGSMIALGLGLGLVFPLLVSITYGFVNTSGNLTCFTSLGCAYGSTFLHPGDILSAMVATALTSLGIPAPSGMLVGFAQLIQWVSYIVAGFTFLPFLNFLVLDAFIIDLSSALGERMEFMSLLTGLV